MSAPLAIQGLTAGYGPRPVLRDVSVELAPHELVAVVGPNGAGKSTLLRAAVGILAATSGRVSLFGKSVTDLPRREIAKLAAFVPQATAIEFDFTVRELVAMGRTPHLGRFQPASAEDRRAVDDALAAARLETLADRRVTELSGGERQRALLARAFAQEAPLLVLDEPSASLDLLHAFELLELVRTRVARSGAALLATHDLGLAARFADRVVALDQGTVAAAGPAREVLSEAMMKRVFGVDAVILRDGGELAIAVRGPSEREKT